jgi:hypothetical protein
MNDVSNLAPDGEPALDKQATEASEVTIGHGYVPLTGMAASDAVGSILVAWVVSRLYGVPLNQDSAQLWSGIC